MSRPDGPPPHTVEEIALLETPEKRAAAQAELSSYVWGHKMADLRDEGLLGATTYNLTNNKHTMISSRRDSSTYRSDTPDVNSNEDYQSPPGGDGLHPQRRPMRNRRGRELARHQPYPSASSRYHESTKSNVLCQNFTSTGTCARLRCPDNHEVDKLALCKQFLYKHVCPKDELCSLSHIGTPENTPHCLYYLENRCTSSHCMFAHVHIDRNALVCASFGRLGYCNDGETCTFLHVYECPDFANTGVCAANEKCSLKHVYHASRMKATARKGSDVRPRGTSTDISGADVQESLMFPSENRNHSIALQHDYIAFESQDQEGTIAH